MGIFGLWELLAKQEENYKFQDLSQVLLSKQCAPLVLGVDSMNYLFQAKTLLPFGKNPTLAMLFSRCTMMLELNIFPIFVFDGPNKPTCKKTFIRSNREWELNIQKFQEMIELFGFVWMNVHMLNNRNFYI